MQPSCYLPDLYRFAAELRMKGDPPGRGMETSRHALAAMGAELLGQGNSNSAPTAVPGPLCLAQALEDHRHALAAADAHGLQPH
jgi:hypothetical protein